MRTVSVHNETDTHINNNERYVTAADDVGENNISVKVYNSLWLSESAHNDEMRDQCDWMNCHSRT